MNGRRYFYNNERIFRMSDFQWLAYVVFMVWYLSYVLTDWCRVLVFYAYTLSLALGVVKSQSALQSISGERKQLGCQPLLPVIKSQLLCDET